MAFTNLTKDFANETLEICEKHKGESVQLINSLFGLLLFINQKDFDKNKKTFNNGFLSDDLLTELQRCIKNTVNDTSLTEPDLYTILYHMRSALSVGNIKAEGGKTAKNIKRIVFANEYENKLMGLHAMFKITLPIETIRDFVPAFARGIQNN